jgi:hypothetical protein
MKATQKELDEAVGEIVDRIMERGRLSQLERQGEIGVKDGGVSLRRIQFINELKQYAETEAVALATRIIGEDRKVRVSFTDISDEEPVANPADNAILAFQNSQKEILEHYQNPQPTPVTHYQEETLVARGGRVDRDKPAMRDEAQTGLEQLSENEE